MKWLTRWTLVVSVLFVTAANAQMTIEINQGQDDPTPIAIVPFSGGNGLPEDVASIISNDLQYTGQFAPLDRANMLGQPTQESEVYYRDWRAVGSDYLVIGKMTRQGAGYSLAYGLYDVNAQQQVFAKTVSGSTSQLRDMAHTASDQIFEQLTGMRGAFSTKLLYVRRVAQGGGQYKYSLMQADADGQREKVILSSEEPILSPTWSPTGKEIAYVSFATSRPAIYRRVLATGQTEQLTRFKGLNSAPAFSPDGRKLAMVLSKDGSPDIYIMDLASKRLTRVTKHYAIETEPNWSRDGKSIFFTSDRGGSPQIYKVDLATGQQQRVTFDGAYNARARVLRDGSGIVMVHRSKRGGDFHIALLNVKRNTVRMLSGSTLDESPTVAPNGSMMLYATKRGGRSILSATSIDGSARFNLPARQGDIREPSWSPFLN